MWLVVLLWLGLPMVRGQTPSPDNFDPRPNGWIYSLAVQTDGKILVGGGFASLGGQPRLGIGRLNTDGTLDNGFNPGANGSVYSLASQADRKILVGGDFTTLGGQTRNRIARLNADGSLDIGFNPDANNAVSSLLVQVDGKTLVGGFFTNLGGQLRSCIGRLNADGTLDNGFNPAAAGGGIYATVVSSLALQADEKILVGGRFDTLDGQPRTNLARLNPDGSLDKGFYSDADLPIYTLAVQADGKILAGGAFTTMGGQPRTGIARLNADGTLDSGFNPGANNVVYSLALQADGKIVVGGLFTTLDEQQRNKIGRLNPDGSLDHEFDPGAGDGVYSLALQADGRILVGGFFTTLGGQPRSRIGRLYNTAAATQSLCVVGATVNWSRGSTSPEVWRTMFESSSDGVTWTFLGAGARISGGWQLDGASIPPGGTLRARGFVAGGYQNGSSWPVEEFLGAPAFISQPTSQTNNLGEVATFRVLAAGSQPLSYQWLKDDAILPDLGQVLGADTPTLTLSNVTRANEGDYSLVVSNSLSSRTSLVARLTVNDPFILVHPASQSREFGQSATLAAAAAGTPVLNYQWWHNGLLVHDATNSTLALTNLQASDAGDYSVVVSNQNGSVTSAVALLTVNLVTLDGRFNPDPGMHVSSLAVEADGNILVGLWFMNNLDGQPLVYASRLDRYGNLSGFDVRVVLWYVYSLTVQEDGRILVGGSFTMMGGQSRIGIGLLSSGGSLDGEFNPGTMGSVSSVAVQADGKILVGGSFTMMGGQSRSNIARVNADGTLDSGFNPGANDGVYSLAVQADGRILVGGVFYALGGQLRGRIARLNPDGILDSGFNPEATHSWQSSFVSSLAVQADGKILVGGNFTSLGGQSRTNIARLNPDGTLDSGFNPGANGSVYSLASQADRKILVGGDFTTLGGQPRNRIARLNPDGRLDSRFNPGANALVHSLAVQADGKILAAGNFTTLAGRGRNYFGRLNNTESATNSLNCRGSTITWLRGGTSPEVWRTTFEVSSNGNDWVFLGPGVRISGGWELNGIEIQPAVTLRARGFTTGGYQNGSGWFLESLLQLDCSTGPTIVVNDGRFGFGTNGFGFTITGKTSSSVVVESSTNLILWLPLDTNFFGNGSWHFIDPTQPQMPQRFYRVRQWP